jgi:integrase
MARPPTPVGTYGVIKVKQIGPKRWEARARFRLASGATRRLRQVDDTKAAAIRKLKIAANRLIDEITSGDVSTSSRFAHVAELWHAEIDREAKLGDRSPNTVRLYRGYLDNWIFPALGQLQMRELTPGACDNVIKRANEKASYDTAKSVRAVLSGACNYAVRHGALTVNPVRAAARLVRGEEKEVVALTQEQRTDLHMKLQELAVVHSMDELGRDLGLRAQVWRDLPDLMSAMLSTGVRIGELLALTPDEVDTRERTVLIDWHVIRVTGQGLVRQRKRKGNRSGLLLRVPVWSVPMWRQRVLASGGGPLFSSWDGKLLDPSNVINRVKLAFGEIGYDWVTSHVFRKTVASVLDEAGLPIGAVADQLGNTRAVVERHYVARRVANDASAAALEGMVEQGGTA